MKVFVNFVMLLFVICCATISYGDISAIAGDGLSGSRYPGVIVQEDLKLIGTERVDIDRCLSNDTLAYYSIPGWNISTGQLITTVDSVVSWYSDNKETYIKGFRQLCDTFVDREKSRLDSLMQKVLKESTDD